MPRPAKLALLVVPVLLVPLVVASVWWTQRKPLTGTLGHAVGNKLEQWCADQLRRIAGDLLTPTLEFSSLQLELPATVTLDDVSLTSGELAFIEMSSMRLEFREPPRRGRPLVIKAATFVDPKVRLVEGPDGTLQGFDGFMKSTTGTEYDDGGSSKPSDFLAIRKIAIRDGMLEYAPAASEHPMRFEQLEVNLTTSPDAARPGWYAFDAKIERAPVVKLSWDGGISIDTGDLAFDDTTLEVDLSGDKYASLTPSVQALLRQYSIVGNLTLRTTGHVPLANTRDTDLTFDASLDQASAAFGDYQFPVDSAQMKATYRKMRFAYDPMTIKAFGGQIDATGSMGFDDTRSFSLNATVRDVLIQNMLRPTPGKEPKLAGKVGLTLDAKGTGQQPNATVSGTGKITIADGRLIGMPVIGALAKALKIPGQPSGDTDRGEIDFTLANDRAKVEKSIIESPAAAAHGAGDVYFDGRLDLAVNAGVVEKAEGLLGGLGDVLGALTDRLLPFHVSGTWSEPVVTPAPLGIGLGGGPDEKQ